MGFDGLFPLPKAGDTIVEQLKTLEMDSSCRSFKSQAPSRRLAPEIEDARPGRDVERPRKTIR